MMPYNYPSIIFPRQQTAAEKTFFGAMKNLRFPSNKFRVWRSYFWRIPTAGELECILAKRGNKLSKDDANPKSLLKAADCFSQAALLCDVKGIADHYMENAAVLLEMAGSAQPPKK